MGPISGLWAPPRPVRLEHSNPQHEGTVVINWCLGNTCNYSCSYCPQGLHAGDKPWPAFPAMRRFLERGIEHFLARGARVFVDFTGGEATLYRELPQLLSFLRERGAGVSLLSNGSRTLDWWRGAAPLLDHVSLSFHAEHAEEGHFQALAKYLSGVLSLHVNVMMHPGHFERCRGMAVWAASELDGVTVSAQPLFENMEGRRWAYSQEQLDYLQAPGLRTPLKAPRKSHRGRMRLWDEDGGFQILGAPELIARGQNRWRGWTCGIGLEQLVVDVDGAVYRGWCREGGSLGSVFRPEEVVFPQAPVRCGRGHCHCVLDAMATKTAPYFQP